MLTLEQAHELRAQIEAELSCISASLSGAASDAVELDQTRVGRLSRMDAMQQQAMDTGMRARLNTQARRLEAALVRVDESSFGMCCGCDEDIARERLLADVAAPFCALCQEVIDEKRGLA